MSSDLMQQMMNGQNGVWTVAVIAGALVGLLDLCLSYWSWRKRRRAAQPLNPDAEAATFEAPADPEPGRSAVREASPMPVASLALHQPVPAAAPPHASETMPPAPVPSFPRRRSTDAVDPSLTAEELLERAGQHLVAGDREQAAAHFRGAIRMAQKGKLLAVEAQARIELGDLSKESGDLTSACEHWQMARVLFAKLHMPADVNAVIERMEKGGCPTDWVLNGF